MHRIKASRSRTRACIHMCSFDSSFSVKSDGKWYCRLCRMYATNAHLSGWRHRKRAKHPDWYLDSLAIADYQKPWFLRSGNTWRCLVCKREANWGHIDSEAHKMRVSCFVRRDNKWWCQRCGCEADRGHLESKRHEESGDAKQVRDKATVSVSESRVKTLSDEMLETKLRRMFSDPDAGGREDELSRQRIEESLHEKDVVAGHGWGRAIDYRTKCEYYYHRIRGIRQWEKPNAVEFSTPDDILERSPHERLKQYYDGEDNSSECYSDSSSWHRWQELRDPISGRFYYYNRDIDSKQWEEGLDVDGDTCEGIARETALKHDYGQSDCWDEYFSTEHNRKYFFNSSTGETVWDLPVGLADVDLRTSGCCPSGLASRTAVGVLDEWDKVD